MTYSLLFAIIIVLAFGIWKYNKTEKFDQYQAQTELAISDFPYVNRFGPDLSTRTDPNDIIGSAVGMNTDDPSWVI
jgi:hypothetical protein